MKWVIQYEDPINGSLEYSITSMNYKKSMSGVNTGTFTVTLDKNGNKCPVGVDVIFNVSETSTTGGEVDILKYGIVTKVGEVNKGQYRLTVVERAEELKKFYVEDADGFVVKVGKIVINWRLCRGDFKR